jgi:hypothetical protein
MEGSHLNLSWQDNRHRMNRAAKHCFQSLVAPDCLCVRGKVLHQSCEFLCGGLEKTTHALLSIALYELLAADQREYMRILGPSKMPVELAWETVSK